MSDPMLRGAAREASREWLKWVRLFNRLDAAISKHRAAKEHAGFCDDADEALHAAHDRVLKAATKRADVPG